MKINISCKQNSMGHIKLLNITFLIYIYSKIQQKIFFVN